MATYLIVLGWWNLLGSFLLLALINEEFGNAVLVRWTRIFTTRYTLGYYGKFWLLWAAGLNILFGLAHIVIGTHELSQLMHFLVWSDIVIYLLFSALGVWGLVAKRCGVGIYVAFSIFTFWIIWGLLVIY